MKKLVVAGIIFLFGHYGFAEKTFVYCSEGSPSTFNPQMATDTTTFNAVARTVYNRLVEWDSETSSLKPSLAEKWEISKNGKEVTFFLRKGVRFQQTKYFTPSREFNAKDVVFSLQRMMDPAHPYHKVNGGNYNYFRSLDMDKIIKDVVAIGEHKVKFILHQQGAPFVADMAREPISILSAEYGEQLVKKEKKQEIDWLPVGTGPFVLKKYVKDTVIRFFAHPHYFEGKAEIEKLIYSITPDANVRTMKLKTGECDLIAEPAFTDLDDLRSDKRLRVLEEEGVNLSYLAMNIKKKPFDNILVRRAINHALNKKAYLKAIYYNHAEMAINPIPPSMWGYNEKIKDYEYNVEKSKELLKKAGYEKGFETEMWVLPIARPYNPNGRKLGELMQADLAKIGVQVRLVQFDWPTYLAKSRTGEHEIIQLGWIGDSSDPDGFLTVLLTCGAISGGSNRARWCHQEFDKIVNQARTEKNIGERKKLYYRAQEIFKEQAPWVPLAHVKVFRAMSKKVKGFRLDSLGRDTLYGVRKD